MTPTNALTERQYQGGNIFTLLQTGYENQIWATYRQWKQLGKQVQKGQKGVKLIKIVTVENLKAGEKVTKQVPRSFTVFNVAQVKDIEKKAA